MKTRTMLHSAIAIVLATAIFIPAQAADSQDPLRGVERIVFVGDSITDGDGWTDWVVETLKANGHPDLLLLNEGISGNTSSNVRGALCR